MPSWKELLEQLDVIKGAPYPFLIAFVIFTIAVGGLISVIFSFIYRTRLADKDSRIELLNAQISDYKEKLSGASPDQAETQIGELIRRLAKVEPRGLSAEQAKIIRRVTASVRRSPSFNITIQSDTHCADCAQYAADFLSALDNWTVKMLKIMGPTNVSPKGLAIVTADSNHPFPEAAALVAALTAADIPFDLKSNPGDQMSHILISPRASF